MNKSNKEFVHVPVLAKEVMESLDCQKGMKVADLTLGLGGHAEMFCKKVGKGGLVVGMDRDQKAIDRAEEKLGRFKQMKFKHGNFKDVGRMVMKNGLGEFDAVLVDLGVSSMQLDDERRGFSFMRNGRLDMRMDESQQLSAMKVVNNWEETELRNIFQKYGEEKKAGMIAKAIIKARPVKSTQELAELIERVKPRLGAKIHPATKVFQAIRMTVNDEIAAIKKMLPQVLEMLKPGGRLAVISFHSLEDREVKKWMKEEGEKCKCEKGSPICQCEGARMKILTKKPIVASEEETSENSRSRSAKLRVAEKI